MVVSSVVSTSAVDWPERLFSKMICSAVCKLKMINCMACVAQCMAHFQIELYFVYTVPGSLCIVSRLALLSLICYAIHLEESVASLRGTGGGGRTTPGDADTLMKV